MITKIFFRALLVFVGLSMNVVNSFLIAQDTNHTNEGQGVAPDVFKMWIGASFEEFDRKLERDSLLEKSLTLIREHNTIDAHTIADDGDNFVAYACTNWASRPDLFELSVRYSTKMQTGMQHGRSLMHKLAESSILKGSSGFDAIPMLYFNDMFLLAVNGSYVNTRDEEGISPFEIISKRIMGSQKFYALMETRLSTTLQMFYSLATSEDPLLKSDARIASEFFNEKTPSRLFTPILESLQFASFPTDLKCFKGSDFSAYKGVYCNRWLFKTKYKNVEQNEFSRLFRLISLLLPDDRKSYASILKENSVWINEESSDGITLAFQAYCANDLSVLELLLKSGAFADQVVAHNFVEAIHPEAYHLGSPAFLPREGDTLLLAASLDPLRKLEYIPLLLDYTKKPDARDLLNRNALHRFLYHRVQEDQNYLIMLLIGAGADVNAKSVSGNTPCHVAVNRNAHLIKDLIGAGADFYAKNDRGETPMDLLKRSIDEKWIFHEKNAQVLKDLEERGLLKEKE